MHLLKSKWALFIPFVGAFIFYNYAFNRDYFMLVEGRAYIAQAIKVLDGSGFWNWLSSISLHTYVTQRITNQAFYLLTSSVCGIGIECQNLFQILLISLTALLISIFAYQLRISVVYCIFLSLLWVFSHGVLHAVSWQATGLEKLLGFFVMLYLVVFNYFGSKSATKLNTVLSNLVLGFILLAALSSKEHSALLFPISVLLAMVKIYQKEWLLKPTLKKIVLPSVIALVHAVLFFVYIALPLLLPKTAGIYDGNIISNLFMFMGFAFNSYENYDAYNPVVTYGIWGSFLILIVLQISDYIRRGTRPSQDFLYMLWAGASSIGFLMVMARLHYQNRYYLLVPDLFLFILFFFILKLLINRVFIFLNKISLFKRYELKRFELTLVFILCLSYGLWHGNAFLRFYRDDYAPFAQQARNFISERSTVEKNIPNVLKNKIYMVSEVHGKIASVIHTEFPPDVPRYVGAFWLQQRNYLNGSSTEWLKFVDLKDFSPDFPREKDSYYVIFNKNLMIEQIDKGSSVIFQKSKGN